MRLYTGAISKVYMLVLEAEVRKVAMSPTSSTPVNSWLKKWGWPVGKGGGVSFSIE